MKRGTICWINLEDASPPEYGKVRPGIVISNSEQNDVLETVVIVPLSSRPKEIWPLRLRLMLPSKKESFAVLPGIRQVHKKRLLESVGRASPTFLAKLDQALHVYLTDD